MKLWTLQTPFLRDSRGTAMGRLFWNQSGACRLARRRALRCLSLWVSCEHGLMAKPAGKPLLLGSWLGLGRHLGAVPGAEGGAGDAWDPLRAGLTVFLLSFSQGSSHHARC